MFNFNKNYCQTLLHKMYHFCYINLVLFLEITFLISISCLLYFFVRRICFCIYFAVDPNNNDNNAVSLKIQDFLNISLSLILLIRI